ncbi:hypothetical protein BCR37DRAFT_390632 [Protomyces lactucae-debilis]|uniref:Uncharacterized protein n=1 Tax=Protomyces lactucae-debilis TaxID=2754530 RepID=A0A1Y2FSD6_PROLT|nr:uncharacterized protein BCR37DRAFT_390632 [Protomyces lactucae-debilis]ORY86903.1 hypothetical protein BCR37DRAFT_390632 [Protomyces lactucae-debilis]
MARTGTPNQPARRKATAIKAGQRSGQSTLLSFFPRLPSSDPCVFSPSTPTTFVHRPKPDTVVAPPSSVGVRSSPTPAEIIDVPGLSSDPIVASGQVPRPVHTRFDDDDDKDNDHLSSDLSEPPSDPSDIDDLSLPIAKLAKVKAKQTLPKRVPMLGLEFSSEEDEAPRVPKKGKSGRKTRNANEQIDEQGRKLDFSIEKLFNERQERLQDMALVDRVAQGEIPEEEMDEASNILDQTADEESVKRLEQLMQIPKMREEANRHAPFFLHTAQRETEAALLEDVPLWLDQLPASLSLNTQQDMLHWITSSACAMYMQYNNETLPDEVTQLALALLYNATDEHLVACLYTSLRALLRGAPLSEEDVVKAIAKMGGRDATSTTTTAKEQQPFSWLRVRQLAALVQLATQRSVQPGTVSALLPLLMDEQYAPCLIREMDALLVNYYAGGQQLDLQRLCEMCPLVPLQVTMLDALPTSSQYACEEIQRIACAFLQSGESVPTSPTHVVQELEKVLTTHKPFHPLNATTDYPHLSASLDVLSHALIHLEDPYEPSLETGSIPATIQTIGGFTLHCSPYIAQLIGMCEVLQRKHARIVDSKAALLYRTEAKSKIQRLQARLRYQVEALVVSSEAGFELRGL